MACSGAKVHELAIDAQANTPAPQLTQLRALLCPAGMPNCTGMQMPQIDALVTSISGNDAGFSGIIFDCGLDGGTFTGPNCSSEQAFNAR